MIKLIIMKEMIMIKLVPNILISLSVIGTQLYRTLAFSISGSIDLILVHVGLHLSSAIIKKK